jgi:hypothetical protein
METKIGVECRKTIDPTVIDYKRDNHSKRPPQQFSLAKWSEKQTPTASLEKIAPCIFDIIVDNTKSYIENVRRWVLKAD